MNFNSIARVFSHKVSGNLAALGVLQVGNYLLPLILVPYLVRTLGLRDYGLLIFAGSFVAIFRTVVAFGFDLTATRDVSLNREEPAYLGILYTNIVSARGILLSLSILVLATIGNLFTSVAEVLPLALLCMAPLVGEAIFPVWLFQGMERMAFITALRLASKFVFVGMVVVLVKDPAQIYWVPVIEGIASLAAGLAAVAIALRKFGILLAWPKWRLVIAQMREASSVFLSDIAVHFYTTVNTIFLGSVVGPIAVANYAIAEKVYYAARGMVGIIVQAVYPTVSRIYGEDKHRFYRTAILISLGYGAILTCVSVPVFLLSDPIVKVISGSENVAASKILSIFCFALPLAMGSLFSSFLVLQRKTTSLMVITFATLVVNAALLSPLVHMLGVEGAAWAFLGAQALQLCVQLFANRSIFTHAFDRGLKG